MVVTDRKTNRNQSRLSSVAKVANIVWSLVFVVTMSDIVSANEKRAEERALRKLWQVVFKRIREKNFQYVLQRQAPGKICFGSGVERQCLPMKGPAKSPLMRRFIPDNLIGPGPAKYNLKLSLLNNYPNKFGYAGLAYKVPRVTMAVKSAAPPIGTYELVKHEEFKQCRKPFNIGTTLMKKQPFLTPPPGTYNFRKRNIVVSNGFGRQRINFPAVQVICTPRNLAKCILCEETPLGDYWRNWTSEQDMCRPCMLKERKNASVMKSKSKKIKRLSELDKFVRVRYCGFYHDHNGTKAAVKLMSNRHLAIKYRTENYLSMFYY